MFLLGWTREAWQRVRFVESRKEPRPSREGLAGGTHRCQRMEDPGDASVLSPRSSLSFPGAEVVIENRCCWIRNALTIEEQIEVLGDILDRSKHNNSRAPKTFCMNPSPKTILFDDGNTPKLRFGAIQNSDGLGGDDIDIENEDSNNDNAERTPTAAAAATTTPLSSVYDRLILRRAMSLASACLFPNANGTNGADVGAGARFAYDRYSVAAIRYSAPNGSFPEHIDHCNDPNGWVVLLSLGCEALFTVRGPCGSTPENLRLGSGDVMVFDPSTEAAVRHGVASIVLSTCPERLARAFGAANHRYGIQCRTSLQHQARTTGLGR